jgi:hypothetical protein
MWVVAARVPLRAAIVVVETIAEATEADEIGRKDPGGRFTVGTRIRTGRQRCPREVP